jgi:uncharacterized protein GlcG (DUF336 family)
MNSSLISKLRALFLVVIIVASVAPARAVVATATDVQTMINQASRRASQISPNSTIAVVDREGNVLVVWATGVAPTPQQIGEAISRAGTASVASSNQNALTTRSIAFVVQDNFPPGIENRSNGPLTGINNSHFPYSDVNRFRAPPFPVYAVNPAVAPSLASLGAPILNTSLSGFIGGLPLYKNGDLIGGIGVVGDGNDTLNPLSVLQPDVDEDVALAGQFGYEPSPLIRANRIFLEGLSLPYVKSATSVTIPAVAVGAAVAAFPLQGSPLPAAYPNVNIYPPATIAGIAGELRSPIVTDVANPSANRLTAADVQNLIDAAVRRALITRSGVRQPRGGPASMYIAIVGLGDRNSVVKVAPPVLGLFRMPDAVTRSWEFTVQKARTCVGFSSASFAFTTRSVGFLSQNYFPPGIKNTTAGFLQPVQASYSDPTTLVQPNNFFRNGITIFPGGQPLYKGTELVGAIGVSGDAIDQDDITAAAAAATARADGLGDFSPPISIRADAFAYRGVRLPYAKFPRQPSR